MYSSNQVNKLFSERPLSDYLRERTETIKKEIKNLTLDQISDTEVSSADELIRRNALNAPSLLEDRALIDAKESRIHVHQEHDGFKAGFTPDLIQGLSITVKIPFEGSSALFKYAPSTYSLSGTPHGKIEDSNLVLNYETREKDPEIIKQLWSNDINVIKQHLSWTANDVSQYNGALADVVRDSLNQRKAEAENNQSLIGKLKY